ncbi:MAG TPA: NYN domain-containing protein [Pirellulaceae bacterium]|nr:NYN domain-containing protein [Pirellulaceae bacterium]
MKWLIDGYNVCFAVGLLSQKVKDDELRQARIALLGAIREGMPEQDVRETVVVFDSQVDLKLPDEPEVASFPGKVLFSSKYREADDLIEELIRRESRPEKLTVVSSDGRIVRAANRRKATPLSNEAWWDALREGKLRRRAAPPDPSSKPMAKPLPSAEETAKWSAVFAIDEETLREEVAGAPELPHRAVPPAEPEPAPPAANKSKPKKGAPNEQPKGGAESSKENALPQAWEDFAKQLEEGSVEIGDVPRPSRSGSSAANPFGEGYADDLLADQTWLKDDKTIKRPGEGKKKG